MQLGNAPLPGLPGSSTDQVGIIWQTIPAGSGTEDSFVVDYRQVGQPTWTSAVSPASFGVGVGGRVNHHVTLTGLSYNTDYEYRVEHHRGMSVVDTYQATFHTRLAAGSTAPFTFTAYGDSAYGPGPTALARWAGVAARNAAINPAFTLLAGDNVYNSGTHDEFDYRLDPTVIPENTNWIRSHVEYATVGNHDSLGPHQDNWMLPVPALGSTSPVAPPPIFDSETLYSFDYGNVHFATFNSTLFETASATIEQSILDWLAADLAASTATWKVVFTHIPLASRIVHAEDHAATEYFRDLLPVLKAANVDLLLVAHAHDYQRSYPLTGQSGGVATYVVDSDNDYAKGAGVVQVINGAGGREIDRPSSPLNAPNEYDAQGFSQYEGLDFGVVKVNVTTTQLAISFITDDGVIMDSFTITDSPDTTPPTASLSAPLDGGLFDQDTDVGDVAVRDPQSFLKVHLADEPGGTGINDATVTSATVVVKKNSLTLVPGVDYTFGYDAAADAITLSPTSGSFTSGTYEITLNGGAAKIRDHQSLAMVSTTLNVEINGMLPPLQTAIFRQGLAGYTGAVDTELDDMFPTTANDAKNTILWEMRDYLLGPNRWALLKFDDIFGAIPPGAVISGASLVYDGSNVNGAPSDVYEVAIDWDTGVTPNTFGAQPSVQTSDYRPTRIAIAPPGDGQFTLDVTSSIADWFASPGENHGWLFHWYGKLSGGVRSSEYPTLVERPTLMIHYFAAPDPAGPTASAGVDQSVGEGSLVSLSAALTTHPTQSPATLTYLWDLDHDGIYDDASGMNVSLAAFPDEGTVEVAVWVSDSVGRTSTDTATITVNNVAPMLILDGTDYIGMGSAYTIFLSADDPGDDTITTWEIDWGDGVVSTYSGNVGDIDGDLDSDFQDFLQLQVGYGMTTDATRQDGDLDDDGDVDFSDFLVLQVAYGSTASAPISFATHIYPSVLDTYTINATATDEDGSYAAPSIDVTVTDTLIDNEDPGFSVIQGTWTLQNAQSQASYQRDHRTHAAGTGTAIVRWEFTGLSLGDYDVLVTWLGDAANATNARYQVFDGGASEGIFLLDQQGEPGGAVWDGRPWQSLGSFLITSGTLRVELSDLASGTIMADAVRFEYTGADSTGTIPGDADGDSDVDFQDFLALQASFGMTIGATVANGDFTADGRVDHEDLVIWHDNVAASAPVQAAGYDRQRADTGLSLAELLAVDRVLTSDEAIGGADSLVDELAEVLSHEVE